MDKNDFRKHAHEVVDWMADYLENTEHYPVKSQLKPGEILSRLPDSPPDDGESFQSVMEDMDDIIMPGITHWQSPNFFAYFPANASPPSILAEMITATLGAQCMIWDTSPAAAELEERVMQWLRDMLALPKNFEGVIQDTASTATLCALLSAREKHSNYNINNQGFREEYNYRVYCSSETHSSIEKAVKIAGIGKENLIKIAVDGNYSMDAVQLKEQIQKDKKQGYRPLCVIATIGTTGSTAIDPCKAIGEVCREEDCWFHIDAAYGGTAMILPEYQWLAEGAEHADSFVFNPHKWMFTNFDCSAYFVRDKESLIRTFEILPEYLKTKSRGMVNDYRDWGIQLGRRFRALKLWFVIRSYGIKGLQEKIRNHISYAKDIQAKILESEDFELLAPVPFSTLCFRYHPDGTDESQLNEMNARLLEELNSSGKIFMTHTKLNGVFTIRMQCSQTELEKRHIETAWSLICETARNMHY